MKKKNKKKTHSIYKNSASNKVNTEDKKLIANSYNKMYTIYRATHFPLYREQPVYTYIE